MQFPQKIWTRSTPESLGIDSHGIADALSAIRDSHKDIHSMLIIRHGVLCFEHYFAPYTARTAHSMYSCSKTFTSMLIGIAQSKGLLSIHDRVLEYFPDVQIEKPNANLEQMTLRDLLIMCSGHGEDTFDNMVGSADGDWARVFLNQEVDHVPGTHFVYNTGATYMLSAILTRVTGRTAHELAQDWIFNRIGIEESKWDTCPKGISMGGTGLHIRPLDMARFGLLLLNGGRWNEDQIIPAEYIAEASTKQICNKSDDPNQNPNWAAGYCYQMWRCAFDAFRADGMGGQYIVMLPQHELIFVFTSALGSDIGYPLDIIRDHLLPAIHAGHIPENARAQHDVNELARSVSHPCHMPVPSFEGFAWNQNIDIAENAYNITHMCFGKDILSLTVSGVEIRLPYQFGAPVATAVPVSQYLNFWFEDRGEDISFAASAYDWGEPAFKLNRIGEPLTLVFVPRFKGDSVSIELRCTMGDSATLAGRLE